LLTFSGSASKIPNSFSFLLVAALSSLFRLAT
jgi:hypothetical protein